MKLGKVSAALGIIAVICVSLGAFSVTRDDGVTGPITYVIEELISYDSGDEHQLPELTQSGFSDINEPNIRFLLKVLAIVLSLLAGILAIIAARNEQNSLWYSIGVFASLSAITEINYLVAGIYAGVFIFLVLRSRKWKMTIA